jgi:hypothetical protein
MSIVFNGYRKAWDFYAKRKYRKNEEWLKIQNGILREKGTIYYSYPDEGGLGLFTQLEIEHEICPRTWKNPLAWGWMIYWWNKKSGPRQQYYRMKYFIQRGKRGYSNRDLWGFDNYLSTMLPTALRQLADVAHGYPSEDGMTFEKWQEMIRKMADGFEAMSFDVGISQEEYEERKKKFREGMELFIEYYENLWD